MPPAIAAANISELIVDRKNQTRPIGASQRSFASILWQRTAATPGRIERDRIRH